MQKVNYLLGTSNWNDESIKYEGLLHSFVNVRSQQEGNQTMAIIVMESGSLIAVKLERVRFVK